MNLCKLNAPIGILLTVLSTSSFASFNQEWSKDDEKSSKSFDQKLENFEKLKDPKPQSNLRPEQKTRLYKELSPKRNIVFQLNIKGNRFQNLETRRIQTFINNISDQDARDIKLQLRNITFKEVTFDKIPLTVLEGLSNNSVPLIQKMLRNEDFEELELLCLKEHIRYVAVSRYMEELITKEDYEECESVRKILESYINN